MCGFYGMCDIFKNKNWITTKVCEGIYLSTFIITNEDKIQRMQLDKLKKDFPQYYPIVRMIQTGTIIYAPNYNWD